MLSVIGALSLPMPLPAALSASRSFFWLSDQRLLSSAGRGFWFVLEFWPRLEKNIFSSSSSALSWILFLLSSLSSRRISASTVCSWFETLSQAESKWQNLRGSILKILQITAWSKCAHRDCWVDLQAVLHSFRDRPPQHPVSFSFQKIVIAIVARFLWHSAHGL